MRARGGTPRAGRLRRALWRVWNVGARAPLLADRRGLRWLLAGRVVGAPILILAHRGRRTGRLHRTPVEAIVERPEASEIIVSPMRGKRGEWYRNVLAGGLEAITLRGESFAVRWRELSEEENREALGRYVSAHPVYGRAVLWFLARGHRLRGRSLDAVAVAIPMLALRRRSE